MSVYDFASLRLVVARPILVSSSATLVSAPTKWSHTPNKLPTAGNIPTVTWQW